MHSYSQNMEDLMLYRLLRNKEKGFYIDIGAHDPDELSVTKLFYEKGWSGINVEPVAASFKKIEKARERDINIHAVISDIEGYSYFYEITGGKNSYDFDPSALSSLDQEVIAEACKKFNLDYDIIRIKSYRLETICKKYCIDTEIDFMKIDVEGLELTVLQSGNFQEYRPKVLIIEATKPNCNIFETGNPNDQGVWDTFEPFLFSVDYEFGYFDGLNRFYLAKEHQHLQPLFSVPIGIYDGLHLPALQSAHKNLSYQKGQLLAENETLKTQVADLRSEKDILAAQAATLTAEKDALTDRTAVLTSEKDVLAAQAATLAAEKDVLADRMAALTSEKDMLAAQAATLVAEKDVLADRMTALDDTVNSQQARLSSLIAIQEELSEQNAALRKANSILAQHCSAIEQHIHKVSDAFSQFPKTMQAHKAVLENLVKDNVLLRILAIEERYQWKKFPLTKFLQTWQTRKHGLPVVPTLESEMGRCVANQQILDTQIEQAIREFNSFPVMPKVEMVSTANDRTAKESGASNINLFLQKSSSNKNYQLVRNFLHTKHPQIEVNLKTRPAAILGNGPSLRGFDFKRQLQRFDTFGMNAAYRFWDTIDWYPTYYSCLDTTLGMSHKQAIERLIRESENNGIRGFLLRDNLIKALGETGKHPYVVNFDTVRSGNPFLSNNQITTGSHTTSWAAMLGYQNIILLGIDANYVEILPEAKPVEGIVLEIAETPSENPNYFFDAYQQKGDRYHIPNVQKGPEKAVHLVSWRNILPILHFSGCVVVNANPISCVDAFPKCSFPEALEHIATIRAEKENKKAVSSLSGPYTRAQGMECDEISIVRPFLPAKNGIMFDVGAHHGGTSIPFLKDGWEVFAFEPDQERRQILTQNTGSYTSVHIDARAVSDSSGKQVSWYASSESTGIGSMQAFTARHTSKGLVTTVSLAQFCLEQHINHIDFLKIDTEGFDEFVLRGFPFNHIKPACIICEFEDKKSIALCSNIHSIAHMLIKNEYHVYVSEWHPIIRYGIPHQWCRFTPYPVEVLDPMAWGNLIAFARKPDSDKLAAALDQAVRRQS